MDIIFDIDGTLLDISHRLRHIKQKPKNWKAFRDPKEKTFDVPIMPVIRIATALAHAPYPKSERHGTDRSLSSWFLLDGWHDIHNILDFVDDYTVREMPTYPLYMRKEKDYRKDTIVKREMYDQMLEDGYNPKLVFDDRPSVLRMWREIDGLKVVDVGDGLEF